MATHGYGAQITRRTFERARELLDISQDTTLRISVLYGLWVGHIMAIGTHQALQMAIDLLNAGHADEDEQALLVAHRLAGSTYLESGDWARATSHLEQALTIFDKDTTRHSNLSALYGMDPGASACSNLAVAAHVCGFPARAMALAARVRAMADNVSHAIARAPRRTSLTRTPASSTASIETRPDDPDPDNTAMHASLRASAASACRFADGLPETISLAINSSVMSTPVNAFAERPSERTMANSFCCKASRDSGIHSCNP